jgi:hypothetical protein
MANRFAHLFTPEAKAETKRNREEMAGRRGGQCPGYMELTEEGNQTVDEIREYYETHDDPEYGHVAPNKSKKR